MALTMVTENFNLGRFDSSVTKLALTCRSRKTISSDVSIFVFNKKSDMFWSEHYKFILEGICKEKTCRSRKTLSSDVSLFVFNKKSAMFWSEH